MENIHRAVVCFVDSNDFQIDHFKNVSDKFEDKYLPNVICFLDKGVIVKAKVTPSEKGTELGGIEFMPEFISDDKKSEFEWVLLKFSDEENYSAGSLAFLILALNEHLKNCLVLKPNILKYFNSMFRYSGQVIK